MDRFAALSTFVAVAERGGFAAASRHLGMSPPAVTRMIAALEGRLGVPLFRRSTRSVSLTKEGAAFLDRAGELLAQLQEAEHVVMGGQSVPRGELHVTAPVVFGRLHVLPVIGGLLARHPHLTARLMLLDRNVRLVEEGIDVAVRIGELRDSSLRAVPVGTVHQVVVGSPDYLARLGRPAHPKELAGHDRSHGFSVTPRLTVTSIDAQLAAAEAGFGLANVLSYQAAAGLAAGSLCSVLDGHAPPPMPVHLLFDAGRARMPAVRFFIDGMRGRADTRAWT